MNDAYEALKDRVRNLITEHHGIIRTKELSAAGVSYKQVLRMVADGTILREKGGYYVLSDTSFYEEELLVSLFADGVLTMESALYVHGYIQKKPESWQLAVSKNTSKTRFAQSPISVNPYYTEERVLPIGAEALPLRRLLQLAKNIRKDGTSEAALNNGIAESVDKGAASNNVVEGAVIGNAESTEIRSKENEDVNIRVYGIDRLICDVLKYEEKLERDDFKAAVRAYIDDPHKDVAKLLSYAKERKVLKKVQTMIGVWL